jgi:hypothetical protein
LRIQLFSAFRREGDSLKPSEDFYLIRHDSHAYNSPFGHSEAMTPHDDFDPLAPQREAAFFYGLFLRGHSVDALRQDIDIPRGIIDRWAKGKDFQGGFRADLDRVYQYRKKVLAIFEGLISTDHARIQ